MKRDEIFPGCKYSKVVRGHVQVREVSRIVPQKELHPNYEEMRTNPALFQGTRWNKKMVVFRKHYGDERETTVTLDVFAKWAEVKLD